MIMSTTAKQYLIKHSNSWHGVRFYVTDDYQQEIFSCSIKSIAESAKFYLNNKSNLVTLKDGNIYLAKDHYCKFNALITKYRIGKPLKKSCLESLVIKMSDEITICFNTRFIVIGTNHISFSEQLTLESIFNLIKKHRR
jgi:hypothetical protein